MGTRESGRIARFDVTADPDGLRGKLLALMKLAPVTWTGDEAEDNARSISKGPRNRSEQSGL